MKHPIASLKLLKIDRLWIRAAILLCICLAAYFRHKFFNNQNLPNTTYAIHLRHPPKEVESGWLWTVPPTIHLFDIEHISLNSHHLYGAQIDSAIFECSKVQPLTLREYQLKVAEHLTLGDVAAFSRRISNISEKLQHHMANDPTISISGDPIFMSVYFNPETNAHVNYF